MAAERSTFLLDETQIPTQWYNLIPDLPSPPPPPTPPRHASAVRPDDLAPLFPMALIEQEVTTASYVDIPGGVLDVYRLLASLAPGPGAAARAVVGPPAKIFFKVRGGQPGRLAQAEHRRPAGLLQPRGRNPVAHHRDRGRSVGHRTRLRHGAVRNGVRSGSPVVLRPEAGATDHDADLRRHVASQPVEADPGRAQHPRRASGQPGSLGIAISEAVEAAVSREDTRYALGSVLNHVLLHQTVIGQEALRQLELAEPYPT